MTTPTVMIEQLLNCIRAQNDSLATARLKVILDRHIVIYGRDDDLSNVAVKTNKPFVEDKIWLHEVSKKISQSNAFINSKEYNEKYILKR